jgi:predicted short-subunit dehydrogenase-like oxidoreductase (DUF2520 family)
MSGQDMEAKEQKERFSIIGAGRVGTTLGLLLKKAGYRPVDVVDRTRARADGAAALIGGARPVTGHLPLSDAADFIILSVPDREIMGLAADLAEGPYSWEGKIAFHCSGSLPSAALSPLRGRGALTGCLHPIQTFSDPALTARRLKQAWFGIEGCKAFKTLARRLIRDLEGRALDIPADRKVPYHAAAVMASNFLVALINEAADVMSRVGISREEAARALIPLAAGTLSDIDEHGTVHALTGPIERGDHETVRAHLDFLRRLGPLKEDLYRQLCRAVLPLASEKGSPAREIIKALLDGSGEEDD